MTNKLWSLAGAVICLVLFMLATGSALGADNPPRHEIYDTMKTIGQEYNIPPEILYAVGYTESGLEQYNDSGTVLVSPDGGIGIMQVTPGQETPEVNLVLESIHTTAIDQFPGVKVIAKVANRGEEPIEDSFKVTLYNNGQVLEEEISGLQAGAVKQFAYDPQIDARGNYNYAVLIDSQAEVREGNEQDNR